jgi:hypothetical protein
MRRKLVHFAGLLILTACVWGHASELFDHWDNTFRTGNDVESSVIIAALAAGVVLALAYMPPAILRMVRKTPESRSTARHSFLFSVLSAEFIGHSPPLPLRI